MPRRKNIFAAILMIAVLIVGSNNVLAFAHEYNVKSNSDYQEYDMNTGEVSYHFFEDLESNDENFSPGYFPNGLGDNSDAGISMAAVVGYDDDRRDVEDTTVGPYSGIVYIEVEYEQSPNYVYRGTGFMIGPNAVATAAHCVYNSDFGGYPQKVTVVPAKDAALEPFGRETITSPANKLNVCSEYLVSSIPQNDWAVIELSTNFGDRTGWLGLRWQEAGYEGTVVTNVGYPLVVDGERTDKEMYEGDGTVWQCDEYTLIGTWDASQGNSGGPVYANYSSTGYTAIGILTTGSKDNTFGQLYPYAHSTATRITKEMFDLFVSYR